MSRSRATVVKAVGIRELGRTIHRNLVGKLGSSPSTARSREPHSGRRQTWAASCSCLAGWLVSPALRQCHPHKQPTRLEVMIVLHFVSKTRVMS